MAHELDLLQQAAGNTRRAGLVFSRFDGYLLGQLAGLRICHGPVFCA
jgi:hypothetical protein